MIHRLFFKTLLVLLVLLTLPIPILAREVYVAVASNFTAPMKKIAKAFNNETGHKLIISYGSTAKLYTQIINNAPFEVFLSADQEHPKKLVHDQLAASHSLFTFATGKLALFSPTAQFIDPQGNILNSDQFKHLALANPKLSPYGVAAKEVLEKKNLFKKLQSKLVFGDNITQAYQFTITGNAELGFVSFSQVKSNSTALKYSFWLVPQELYTPLKHDAVLLNKGKNNSAAEQFLFFLKNKISTAIITDYGYDLN